MNRTTLIAKLAADLGRRFPNVELDVVAEAVNYTTEHYTDAELLGADYAELIGDIAIDAAFA